MSDAVIVEISDGFAWLTLNRPERRNAFSEDVYHGLLDAVRRVETDDAVRAVGITGSGTAFSAGGDIKGMRDRLDRPSRAAERRWRYATLTTRVVESLFGLTKPLVAAVNGPAVGGGACLALLADVRIAAAEAWFSFPFLTRGLLPDWGATYLVPRAFGSALGLELMLTQRRIGADEAHELGVLSEVVPGDELKQRAEEVLKSLASLAPRPLAALKDRLRTPELGALSAALRAEGAEQSVITGDPAFREAIEQFLDGQRGTPPTSSAEHSQERRES